MAKKKFGFDAMLESSEKKEKIKETEQQTALTIRIPSSLHKELRQYALNHDSKLREVVIDAIRKHIS